MRSAWQWHTRYLNVVTEDNKIYLGLFLGIHEDELILIEDQNHPLVITGQLPIRRISMGQIKGVTVQKAWKSFHLFALMFGYGEIMAADLMAKTTGDDWGDNMFIIAQPYIAGIGVTSWGLYSLIPATWTRNFDLSTPEGALKFKSHILRFTLTPTPASLAALQEASQRTSTWEEVAEVLPEWAQATDMQPTYSLTLTEGGHYVGNGFGKALSDAFPNDWSPNPGNISPDWNFMVGVQYQFTSQWSGWAQVHVQRGYVTSAYFEEVTTANNPFTIQRGLAFDRTSYLLGAAYHPIRFEKPDQQPINFSLGAGIGLDHVTATTQPISDTNTDYLIPSLQSYVNVEYALLKQLRVFVQPTLTTALPTEIVPLEVTESNISYATAPATLTPIFVDLHFGLRVNLDGWLK